MQYNRTQAYMRGDQVVVMRNDLAPEEYTYDGTGLVPNAEFDPELARLGLAHANWSSMAYEEKLYRLPRQDTPRSIAVDRRADVTRRAASVPERGPEQGAIAALVPRDRS